jgi:hypothetical protein
MALVAIDIGVKNCAYVCVVDGVVQAWECLRIAASGAARDIGPGVVQAFDRMMLHVPPDARLRVIVEAQLVYIPKMRNHRTAAINTSIEAAFHALCCSRNVPCETVFPISTRNYFAIESKTKKTQTLQLVKDMVKYPSKRRLKFGSPDLTAAFMAAPKKDDLADCLLHAIAYLHA